MIDWTEIETLLLDMDGTLLDLHYDNFFWNQYLPQRYADIHCVDLSEAGALLSGHYERTRGTLSWYCIDYWSETLALDIPGLKREVSSRIQYRDHASSFLSFLAGQPCRTVIVTNAHPTVIAIKDDATGVRGKVDRVISSHELGHPKEEPAFWDALQAVEDFDPGRSLLIDDNEAVLEAAQAWGIGKVLRVQQPDSHQVIRDHQDFPVLEDFRDLITD